MFMLLDHLIILILVVISVTATGFFLGYLSCQSWRAVVSRILVFIIIPPFAYVLLSVNYYNDVISTLDLFGFFMLGFFISAFIFVKN
ncbi:MAG: hypothetical protein GY714_32290 [Desulfobacterales bacterium]|nr:hypothetical protein [Desulfobacterales bacterium]